MKKYLIILYDKNARIIKEEEKITDDFEEAKMLFDDCFREDKKAVMCLLTDKNRNILLKNERDNSEEDWYNDNEFDEDYDY